MFSEFLKSEREKRNVSMRQLARLAGVDVSYISKLEKNLYQPSREVVKNIAKALNADENEFLIKAGYYPNTEFADKITSDNIGEFIPYDVVRLPIIGVIHAGMPVLATENIIGYEYISRELLNPNHEYFFLKIRGDSMNQIIPEDSIVLVQRQPTLENGEIGIILVNGDEGTIKKFYQQGNIVTLVPASTNPQHQPQIYDITKTDICVIGKAIKVITNL